MQFPQRIIFIARWLLTPEDSSDTNEIRRHRTLGSCPGRRPLPCWIKAAFWYGVAVAMALLLGSLQ